MARKRPEARDRARDDLAGKPPAGHLISGLHAVADHISTIGAA
jgi:hypothetical protein